MGPDLTAALGAAFQHARRAEVLLEGGDADPTLLRDALAGVDAMFGVAVAAAPDELRFHLADARSRIAALVLAADELEALVSHRHAHRLRLRAAAEGASAASRYLRDTSIAV